MTSLPLLALGCVYGLGWLLARRCDNANWPTIAKLWIPLHLFCVSTEFDGTRIGALQSMASRQLDVWGILHRIEGDRLLLIDRVDEIGLDTNVILSDYAIVGLTLCVLLAIRSPALLMSIAMTIAVLISGTLVEQRILLAGLYACCDWNLVAFESEIAFQSAAFLSSASLVASISTLFWLALSPITFRENGTVKGGRLSRMWNRFSRTQPCELMTGRESCLTFACLAHEPMNFGSFRRFLFEYFRSRSWRLLISAVPGSATLLWLMVMSPDVLDRQDPTEIANKYGLAFSNAVAKRDLDKAQPLLERLRELSFDVTSSELKMADAMLSAGMAHKGAQIAEELIRLQPENVAAQLWLARYHLSLSAYESDQSIVRLDTLTGASSLAALQHLEKVVESRQASSETVAVYSILLYQYGQRSRAATILASAHGEDTDATLKLAKLQFQMGFAADARMRAMQLVRSRSITCDSKLSSGDAFVFAEALTLAGQWDEAALLLERNLERYPQDQAISAALVQVWLRLASDTAIMNERTESQSNRLSLLRKIGQMAPLNGDYQCLLARLAFAADQEISPGLQRYCQETLKQAMEADEIQPETFVIIGTGVARDGKMLLAKQFFMKAYVGGNRTSALLNNLAWILFQENDANLQQALKLADQAIAADPRSRDARLTRADILYRIGRFAEAIVDLEHVHRRHEGDAEVVSRLAKCYQAVGEKELASRFRRLLTPSLM